MHTRRSRYLRHRFPTDIIGHAVWLYHRYSLSFRDVEDLLAERGIIRVVRNHSAVVREVRPRLRSAVDATPRAPRRHLTDQQRPAQAPTADGQPDLRGIWDFRTITPLERPRDLAGKEVLTAEEAAAFREETLGARDKDQRASDGIGAQQDVANAYNQFWWDYGDSLTEDRRTSLIVDPPDGRIPWQPAVLKERAERAATRTATRGQRITAGPEDRGLSERCILGFNSGPPMNPSAYNNNVQLLQTPNFVVILNEMVHNARVVPLERFS